MKEPKTGTEQFIIFDRLVFFSALLLTIVIATATTTHPYKTVSTIENPADLLSFESLLNDNPEVPIAGNIEEKAPEAPAEPAQPEEKPAAAPEEKPAKPASTQTSSSRPATPKTTAKKQSQQSSIDWSIIHVDDNGEYFDNNEAPASNPTTPEAPETPVAPAEPQTPEVPEEPTQEEPETTEKTSE